MLVDYLSALGVPGIADSDAGDRLLAGFDGQLIAPPHGCEGGLVAGAPGRAGREVPVQRMFAEVAQRVAPRVDADGDDRRTSRGEACDRLAERARLPWAVLAAEVIDVGDDDPTARLTVERGSCAHAASGTVDVWVLRPDRSQRVRDVRRTTVLANVGQPGRWMWEFGRRGRAERSSVSISREYRRRSRMRVRVRRGTRCVRVRSAVCRCRAGSESRS